MFLPPCDPLVSPFQSAAYANSVRTRVVSGLPLVLTLIWVLHPQAFPNLPFGPGVQHPASFVLGPEGPLTVGLALGGDNPFPAATNEVEEEAGRAHGGGAEGVAG